AYADGTGGTGVPGLGVHRWEGQPPTGHRGNHPYSGHHLHSQVRPEPDLQRNLRDVPPQGDGAAAVTVQVDSGRTLEQAIQASDQSVWADGTSLSQCKW